MRKILFIVFVFLFVADGISIGVVLRTRFDKEGMHIRWASDNFEELHRFLLNGVLLYRCEKTVFNGKFEQQHFISGIQPWSEKDPRWNTLIADKKQALFLHRYLYGTAGNGTAEKISMGGLLQLLCGTDSLFASACGLYFRDPHAEKGKEFVYGLLNEKGDLLAIGEAQSLHYDIDPLPESPRLKCRTKKVMMDWENNLKTEYSSWEIERSADTLQWNKIHNEPIVAFTNPESDDGKIYYSDSIAEEKKRWYYRVRGINHFGGRGPYSAISSCFCYPDLKNKPAADTVFAFSDSVRLQMFPLGKNERNLIDKFFLERSDSFSGEWHIVQTIEEQDALVFEKNRKRVSYYRLNTLLKNGDTLHDWPYLFVLPDDGPPSAPQTLSAQIDSTGKFRLSWDKNNESDVRGYRIFMKNSREEEWLERSSEIQVQNFYENQLSLQTLNKEVWFAVCAQDSSRNNSDYSEAYVLKLPDRLAPPAAVWKACSYLNDTLFLRWSASQDATTELMVYSDTAASFTLKEQRDSARLIPLPGLNYYVLKSCDLSGNCSFSDTLVYQFLSDASDTILLVIRKENKKIRIEVDAAQQDVFRVQLYKSVNGKDAHIISSWDKGSRIYFDRDLKLETDYAYRARIMKTNGKSIWSEWIGLHY